MSDKGFCIAVSSAAALGVVVLIMRFLPDIAAWPGWSLCDSKSCNVQSWLGALSGWVGALAAFGTIGFVIIQIGEQKRQTDFLLGDALPTMDVTPDLDDQRMIVVRIVNWNRRGMIVQAIGANLAAEIGVTEFKLNDKVVDTAKFRWPMPVHGWEDRIKHGPNVLQLKVAAMESGAMLRVWPPNAKVHVTVHILGDTHEVKKLVAAVHP